MNTSTRTAAWQAAVKLDHELACGVRQTHIVAPPTLPQPRPGEVVLAEFPRARGVHLDLHRWKSRPVAYVPNGPQLIVSTPAFVEGFAIGSAVRSFRDRRKAAAMAAAQWHACDLSNVVVTSQRLFLQKNDQTWNRLGYRYISRLLLNDRSLQLDFANTGADPIRLTGDWAPWIAVAVAYHTYGQALAGQMSALNVLRPRVPTARAAAVSPERSKVRTRG